MSKIFTVTELARQIREHLETAFPFVWVRGQVSNLSRPASGHIYFSLKDDNSLLNAVWFRSEKRESAGFDPFTGEVFEGGARPHLATTMENGREVLAAGRISLYGARGACQLVVDLLQDAGIGRLQQEFEMLRLELAAKGWFADERKRPLPVNPTRVAVITSLEGAALQDFLRIAGPRGLKSTIRIHPSLVQGMDAPAGLVRALEEVNAQGWAEVVVLIRGGGSLEDLWAFNDRAVAGAIYNSRIPVLSGVGHEVDVSISDLVADARAATPSHAAQLLWTEREAFIQQVDEAETALQRGFQRLLHASEERLALMERGLGWLSPVRLVERYEAKFEAARERLNRSWLNKFTDLQKRVEQSAQAFRPAVLQRRVDEQAVRMESCLGRLDAAMRQKLVLLEKDINGLHGVLNALDPHLPLERGYSLVALPRGGYLRSIGDVKPGDNMSISVRDGEVGALVTKAAAKDD